MPGRGQSPSTRYGMLGKARVWRVSFSNPDRRWGMHSTLSRLFWSKELKQRSNSGASHHPGDDNRSVDVVEQSRQISLPWILEYPFLMVPGFSSFNLIKLRATDGEHAFKLWAVLPLHWGR